MVRSKIEFGDLVREWAHAPAIAATYVEMALAALQMSEVITALKLRAASKFPSRCGSTAPPVEADARYECCTVATNLPNVGLLCAALGSTAKPQDPRRCSVLAQRAC
jgi:hypothetical protein